MSGWRTALRIAAREARRAKGRAALVLAMIALPVLALSFAAVSYDMFRLTPAERTDRRLGAADALLTWPADGPLAQDPTGDGYGWTGADSPRATPPTADEVRAVLPPGSRVVPIGGTTLALRTATGTGELPAKTLDVADPLTRGMVLLVEGRAPTGDGEVAVSAKALDRLGVRVGDPVPAADGTRTWTVTGVVEFPADLHELVVLPASAGPTADEWLVDTPEPVSWAQVQQLNQRGILVASRALLLDPPTAGPGSDYSATTISVGLLIAGLGTLEVVLLAGPAFAVGARRRQRDLALVAAGGGTPAHLRRIVLADGVVLGVAGAAVGVTLGVAAAFAGRPLLEQYVAQSRAGDWRIFPLALLAIAGLAVTTGVLAALVPACTAARQDIVAGLTGRRGIVRSRRRWLFAGLAMTAAGTGLAVLGGSRTSTETMLAGLVLAELGLVLCTPGLIGLLARFGRLLPLAPRIALRDTARNRASAAPAIAAVMAAVAGSVIIGSLFASDDARNDARYVPAMPHGYITTQYRDLAAAPEPVPVDLVADVARDAGIGVDTVVELRQPDCPAGTDPGISCGLYVIRPPDRWCPYDWSGDGLSVTDRRRAADDPRCAPDTGLYYGFAIHSLVDDGTALPVLTDADPDDLSRATEVLRAGGVVVTDPWLVTDGQVTVDVHRYGPWPRQTDQGADSIVVDTVRLPGYALTTGLDTQRQIFSPAAVARLGLAPRPAGFAMATTATPTVRQEDRLRAALGGLPTPLIPEVERGRGSSEETTMLVLAVAAGIVTLGAAGIATGLAAADGRTDLSTLAAVGASPGVRRLLSLSQSGMIAGLGSLLGVVAGMTGALAILLALNQGARDNWPNGAPYPVTMPWSTLGIVLAVPVVAMLGAGLLTRSRLPVERRID